MSFLLPEKVIILVFSIHIYSISHTMSLDKRLTELRKQNKLSQDALAKKVGIHPNVIGRYERGEAKPTIEVATKMADVFQVSVDYLVGKTDLLIDQNILDQLNSIQKLPTEEKERILFTLEALLRDAKTRAAYS